MVNAAETESLWGLQCIYINRYRSLTPDTIIHCRLLWDLTRIAQQGDNTFGTTFVCPFVDVCFIIPVLFYMLKARFRKSEASSCSVMLYNDVVIDRKAGQIIRLVASVRPCQGGAATLKCFYMLKSSSCISPVWRLWPFSVSLLRVQQFSNFSVEQSRNVQTNISVNITLDIFSLEGQYLLMTILFGRVPNGCLHDFKFNEPCSNFRTILSPVIVFYESSSYSPGSIWSSSHWRSAYKFEIIGGDPSIYSDFAFFINKQTNHLNRRTSSDWNSSRIQDCHMMI